MENTIRHANPMQEIKQWLLVWHEEHLEEYQKFVFDFDRLSVARTEFLVRLCQAVVSNLPEETKKIYEYIKAETGQGEDAAGLEKPAFVKEHEAEVKDCLDGKTILCVRMLSCESVSLPVCEPHEREDGEAVISAERLEAYFNETPREKLMAMVNTTYILDGNYDRSKMPKHQGDMDYAKRLLSHLFVYAMLLMPEFLNNLRRDGARRDDSFVLCLYYFIVLDNGHIKFFDKLSRLKLQLPLNLMEMLTMEGLSKKIVDQSVSKGYATKRSWRERLSTFVSEAKALAVGALSVARGKVGKRDDLHSLDDLLNGDAKQKEEVKARITEYVNQENDTVSLAYLFYIVRELDLIHKCEFYPFCQAVDVYTKRDFKDLSKASKRYHEIKKDKNLLSEEYAKKYAPSKETKMHDHNYSYEYDRPVWVKARRIIKEWKQRFVETRKW